MFSQTDVSEGIISPNYEIQNLSAKGVKVSINDFTDGDNANKLDGRLDLSLNSAGKKIALSGITPGISGTGIAQDHLVAALSFLNADIMNVPRLTIPNAMQQVQDGKLVLTTSAPYLEKQAEAFVKYLG